ncbi:MAG: WxcM-like domain-containing protein [Hymenobacter sp.]
MTLPYLFRCLPTARPPRAGSRWLRQRALPFAVRRAYWITDVPAGQVRGRHTHRTLEQVFMALERHATHHGGVPRLCPPHVRTEPDQPGAVRAGRLVARGAVWGRRGAAVP